MKDVRIRHYRPPTEVIEIEKILLNLGSYIIPPLSGRIDISEYAKKIANYADIVNLEINGEVIGNLAIYLNRKEGFITSFVIHPDHQGMGYGKEMWLKAQEVAISKGIFLVCLDVYLNNYSAQNFYLKQGFIMEKIEHSWIRMRKDLRGEKEWLK